MTTIAAMWLLMLPTNFRPAEPMMFSTKWALCETIERLKLGEPNVYRIEIAADPNCMGCSTEPVLVKVDVDCQRPIDLPVRKPLTKDEVRAKLNPLDK